MKPPSQKSIRTKLLRARNGLSPQERERLGTLAIYRFIGGAFSALGNFSLEDSRTGPRKVGLYRALPDELDLKPLDILLRGQGFEVHYPRVKGDHLEFVKAPPFGASDWTLGSYGIQEPSAALPAVDVGELDLIFVPGVAFDLKGNRIGRGKGYYDRLLKAAPHAVRVSLIFDLQLCGEFEVHEWDQSVQWIISDSREIRLGIDKI